MVRTEDDPGERRAADRVTPLSSDRTWLEVALLASAMQDTAAQANSTSRGTGEGRAVLVVAHDADLRAYIRDCLRALPLRILEAADLTVVAALQDETIELLVLDLSGAPSGPDPDVIVAAITTLAGVSLLLITDEPPSVGLFERTAARVPAVVVKPFNARRLQEEVSHSLGRRALPGQEPGEAG